MKFKTNPIEGVDLTGKIIVLREGVLKRQYDKFENYFYLATGGFGCSPSAIGRAVFTRNIFDGLDERWKYLRHCEQFYREAIQRVISMDVNGLLR